MHEVTINHYDKLKFVIQIKYCHMMLEKFINTRQDITIQNRKRFQWERINTKNKIINAIEIMSTIMGKNKQLYKYETSMDR